MSPKTIVNGIDVGRQRAASSVVPDAQGRTSTEWLGGTQTRTLVVDATRRETGQAFIIDADYPQALLGSGIAPSPSELFLAALGSSFVASFVLAAAVDDVRIESMRVLAAGAVFDQLNEEGARPVANLELRAKVDADAPTEQLERLLSLAIGCSLAATVRRLDVRVHLDRISRTPPS